MFEYIFEIYDKRYHTWYQDFITDNDDMAQEYFNALLKENDKCCVRVITRFNVKEK